MFYHVYSICFTCQNSLKSFFHGGGGAIVVNEERQKSTPEGSGQVVREVCLELKHWLFFSKFTGKVDPRESSNAGCKRGCCGFFLFIVISVVLLGSLAMFFTAVRVHDELYRYIPHFAEERYRFKLLNGYHFTKVICCLLVSTLFTYTYYSQLAKFCENPLFLLQCLKLHYKLFDNSLRHLVKF